MRRQVRNRSARISNRASLEAELGTPIKSVNDQIVAVGKKLARLNPGSQALKSAREWWGRGQINTYSDESFDVLSAMTSEIWRIENGKN